MLNSLSLSYAFMIIGFFCYTSFRYLAFTVASQKWPPWIVHVILHLMSQHTVTLSCNLNWKTFDGAETYLFI